MNSEEVRINTNETAIGAIRFAKAAAMLSSPIEDNRQVTSALSTSCGKAVDAALKCSQELDGLFIRAFRAITETGTSLNDAAQEFNRQDVALAQEIDDKPVPRHPLPM